MNGKIKYRNIVKWMNREIVKVARSWQRAAELLLYTLGCVKQNDGVMLIIFISLESKVGIKI